MEGPDFHQAHAFFAMIYEDVYSAIDPTAENIRRLGEYAPFTLPVINKLREVDDKKVSTDYLNMVVDLYNANNLIIDTIGEAFTLAAKDNEQGIANFLADRDGQHKKWRWQMKAILKR